MMNGERAVRFHCEVDQSLSRFSGDIKLPDGTWQMVVDSNHDWSLDIMERSGRIYIYY